MGFLRPAPPRTPVEVLLSTHGQTFVTWPTYVTAGAGELPALPIGHSHPRSRQWVLADRTLVLTLPGNPAVHAGGIVRHTFNVVSSSWNAKTKTLTSLVAHPSDEDLLFSISTSGVGCACTQGPAGNAGPIEDPYQLIMANKAAPEFSWFTEVAP